MTSSRSVAALASASGGISWLLIWWHQQLAHGATAVNERNLVLGLTWMDSGKLLVVPLGLFAVALVALYEAMPRRGRLATLGVVSACAALAAVAVGVALEFWAFEWGSYEQEFHEAATGVGGALQAAATPFVAIAVVAYGVALVRARVLPVWAVPVVGVTALAMFWLTPTSPLPGIGLIATAGAILQRARRLAEPVSVIS